MNIEKINKIITTILLILFFHCFSLAQDYTVKITSVSFIDSKGNEISGYTHCKDFRLKVITESEFRGTVTLYAIPAGSFAIGSSIKLFIQKAGVVETILSFDDFKYAFVGYSNFKLRTGTISFSPYATHKYTYPQTIQFYPRNPLNLDITIIPPNCETGAPVGIKIPMNQSDDYTITVVKGVHVYNVSTSSLSYPVGYIIDKNTMTTPRNGESPQPLPIEENCTYKIKVEPSNSVDCMCNSPEYEINIPDFPDFKLEFVSYDINDLDNTGKDIQIRTIGSKGTIKFRITGSQSRVVTISATNESGVVTHFSLFLGVENATTHSVEYAGGFVDYYDGDVSIDLPAGTYDCYALKINSSTCKSNDVQIKLSEPTPITFDLAVTPASCNIWNIQGKIDDGVYHITHLKGGVGDYTINSNYISAPGHDNEGISFDFSIDRGQLLFGNFDRNGYVYCTDENFNVASVKAYSIMPDYAHIDSYTLSPASLSCANDAAVKITDVSGGTAPYEYQYSFSTDAENVSNYSPNTTVSGFLLADIVDNPNKLYVFSKDSKGCVSLSRIDDTQGFFPNHMLQISTTLRKAPTCYGNTDGICTANVSGMMGTWELSSIEPYIPEDQININGNDIIFSDLTSGYYHAIFNETYNNYTCPTDYYFTIPERKIEIKDVVITPVANKGSNTGRIDFTVSGTNDQNFTISLYDADADPDEAWIQTTTMSKSDCFFEGLSGSGEFNLKKYSIEVVDGNNCTYSAAHTNQKYQFSIEEPESQLTLLAKETTPIDCNNNTTGKITLTPSGGWGAPYTFSSDGITWQSDNTFFRGQGLHTFYAKDAKGGISSTQITLIEPDKLGATLSTQHNVECYGTATGWLKYSVSGGTMPYHFVDVIPTNTEASSLNENQYLTAKKLLQGDYALTIKDSRGCEWKTLAQTITEPDKLILTFNSQSDITHEKCENKNNGIIQSSATGGTLPYTYNVTAIGGDLVKEKELNDISAFVADGLPPAGYQLKVTDKMACKDVITLITINEYTNPFIKKAIVDSVICHGQKNGTIEIEAQSGTTNEISKYWWKLVGDSLVNTTGQFDELLAGNYDLYVADNQNCVSLYPFRAVVHQPKGPLSISHSRVIPVKSKGSATGIIQASVTGGNVGLKQVVSNDAFQTNINSLTVNTLPFNVDSLVAGYYCLHVTDNKGCTAASDSIHVIEPKHALGFKVTEKNNAMCKAQTGSFVVEPFGGWNDYKFKLATDNGFNTVTTYNGLYAGSYIVTVRDSMGAMFTDTVKIDEPRYSLMVRLIDKTLPSCGANGSLNVKVSGGTAPYQLVFDGTTTKLSVAQEYRYDNRLAGGDTLITTDSNGCHFNLETLLDSTNMLQIIDLELGYPSTVNGADGSLTAIVTGGTSQRKYTWRNAFGDTLPQTGQTLSGVASGFYDVTVTAGKCSQNRRKYLPGLFDSALKEVALGHETSLGVANGFATFYSPLPLLQTIQLINPDGSTESPSIDDNTTNFSYRNDTLFLTNLANGRYHVLVIDASGNKAFAEFEISKYHEFKFAKVKSVLVKHPGNADGKIVAEVTGGVAPYRFTWMKNIVPSIHFNGVTDGVRGTLSDIDAGEYLVTATDIYHNTISETIKVEEPTKNLKLNIAKFEHESCKDTIDAWVELTAEGGWGDYQYRHDSELYFENSNVRTNLPVRKHTFYLTDKMGVQTDTAITITEPDYLRAKIALVDSVKCNGNSDGNIFFDIEGGTAPYKFAYDSIPHIWITDTVARNQPSRNYRVFISDNNNCIGIDTLKTYLPQADTLLFQLKKVTHTTCNTDNGRITVSLKGGTRPYSYQWIDIDNAVVGQDSTIINLNRSGYYLLNVLDKNNCGQQFTQTINPSTLPTVNTVSTTDVICYGDPTGTATITGVVPAVPYAPYSFKWSNDSTGTSAKGFYAGINHVAVTDTNGCTTTKYFEVATPDTLSLRVAAFKDAHCFGYNDGYVEVEPRGGVGGYRYAWSNGETLPRASNLIKGDYLLTLTDGNDCYITHNYTIDEPEKLLVDLGDDIRICPGNSFRLDGQAFTTHQWANYTGVISNERFVSVNDECDYYLQVTNAIGCFAHDTINLSIGNDALQADFLMTSEAPKNDTLMIFELSNLELDSLRWEYEPEAFNDITGATAADYILNLKTLKNGIYNVSLWAYSGGCVANAVKQVEIIDGNDSIPSDGILGYKDPLIKSMVVAPNPNDGKFTLNIELREEADINVVVYSVDYGVKIDTRDDKNLRKYDLNYQLGGLNTGVYVIMLTAENERRQVKMVIK